MRLLAQLFELQHRCGHLRAEDLQTLAAEARVPLYRLQGLISFYPHFRSTPPPRYEIGLCRDMACWLANGKEIHAQVKECWGDRPDVEVHEVSCLGRCDQAPAALLNGVPLRSQELLKVANLEAPLAATDDAVPQNWRCDPYESRAVRFGLLSEMLALGRETQLGRLFANDVGERVNAETRLLQVAGHLAFPRCIGARQADDQWRDLYGPPESGSSAGTGSSTGMRRGWGKGESWFGGGVIGCPIGVIGVGAGRANPGFAWNGLGVKVDLPPGLLPESMIR